MTDDYGRNRRYLRLSVTDLCPLRCIYCMPEQGVDKLEHGQILTVEECIELCQACAR